MTARIRQSWTGVHRGSALILTVVLTSLLAIVGVLFLMTARIDKMASSATAENREITSAVDALLAGIMEELARDVPGVFDGQEYYDCPDANDPWLADLEPYCPPDGDPNETASYYWRQISDVTGYLQRRGFQTRDVCVDPPGSLKVIREYPAISLSNGLLVEQPADADGDGIADSKWIELEGLRSSKGQPIYAAVRVIDNAAMLNVTTGYMFDPNGAKNKNEVDGHTQLQVNLLALGDGPVNPALALLKARANNRTMTGTIAQELARYEPSVIWQYDWPVGAYTPFDLSDELELRYRFCINSGIGTRLEAIWYAVDSNAPISVPYDGYKDDRRPASEWRRLDDWCRRITGGFEAGPPDRRHLLTTSSMDRIVAPTRVSLGPGRMPGRMVNVNTASEDEIRQAVKAALVDVNLAATGIDPAQIVANIREYIDDDSLIAGVSGETTTSVYYGLERPCVYISELAYRADVDPETGREYKSYAVELHKPYFEDRDPGRDPNATGEWRLFIDNRTGDDVTQSVTWSGTRRFHVLLAEDPGASLEDLVDFNDLEAPADPANLEGYDASVYSRPATQSLSAVGFSEGATIKLERRNDPGVSDWLTVDSCQVPAGWMREDGEARSIQRDVRQEKCIFRLWAPGDQPSTPNLGNAIGNFVHPDSRKLQAHPANRPLDNIGELGQILAQTGYGTPQATRTAEDLVIDVNNPAYANLFNYLTVLDPEEHGSATDETRIKGRINVNTAPAFVLAQLPWMQYQDARPSERVEAIVDSRRYGGPDRSDRPYKSIADLMRVPAMHRLGSDGIGNQFEDPTPGPDLTRDSVIDDLEERDLIFTRISNLVTVRSDVFTAYIVVRIGAEGPQRRVIAILDRSQVKSEADPVRVVALYHVPSPR